MSDKVKNNYPILSFFSGGGFFDMGFEQTNFFEVVWTNELNPTFAELYTSGYTSWNRSRKKKGKSVISHIGSFESLTPEEIKSQAFGDKEISTFGIIGGPPCQDFSSAGSNAGFAGKRGKLTQTFFKYIESLSPSFFVIENVKNLFNSKIHKKELNKLLVSIRKNYYVDIKKLNAINFGVPQDRTRIFIIGIKKEGQRSEFMEKEFFFPDPKIKEEYKDALKKYDWPKVDSFQNGVKRPKNIPESLYVDHCLLNEKQEHTVANGTEYFKPYSQKFLTVKEGDTRKRSFKRLHRYRYSPTACYGNNEVHLHPYLPRRLSVREVLRIQSVPDSYKLSKHITLTSKFKMIGNAVPYLLASAVADTLKDFLLNKRE